MPMLLINSLVITVKQFIFLRDIDIIQTYNSTLVVSDLLHFQKMYPLKCGFFSHLK